VSFSYIDNELRCLVMLYAKELENLRREAEVTAMAASAKQGFTFDKMLEASKDFASAWNTQGKKVHGRPMQRLSPRVTYASVCL
jgi:hypothetical protein